MDTSNDTPTTSTPWVRPVAASLATLLVGLAATGIVWVLTASHQAAHPPTCYGIGFGCTPGPTTGALLVGAIMVLPAVATAWVVSWVGWALTRSSTDRVNRAAAWWPVGALAVIAGVTLATSG